MGLFGGVPHCKKCGGYLEGDEEVCPHCAFHPRNEGLRYAGFFLLIVAILFTAVVLTGGSWPYLAAYGMLGVFIFFLLAMVAFVISFLSTPYRFGSLFT